MKWAAEQQQHRVPNDAIPQLRARRFGEILTHGQRRHVAMAAAIEIARGRMMQRVIVPPMSERRQRHDAGQKSDDVIEPARREERTVRAVVHENERADEPAGGRQREQEGGDERPAAREVNGHDTRDQRNKRRYQLKRRAPRIRADERLDCAAPVRSRRGRYRGGGDWTVQRPNFVTFSAAGPFWPCTMSNSTRSPSASVLKPSP